MMDASPRLSLLCAGLAAYLNTRGAVTRGHTSNSTSHRAKAAGLSPMITAGRAALNRADMATMPENRRCCTCAARIALNFAGAIAMRGLIQRWLLGWV